MAATEARIMALSSGTISVRTMVQSSMLTLAVITGMNFVFNNALKNLGAGNKNAHAGLAQWQHPEIPPAFQSFQRLTEPLARDIQGWPVCRKGVALLDQRAILTRGHHDISGTRFNLVMRSTSTQKSPLQPALKSILPSWGGNS